MFPTPATGSVDNAVLASRRLFGTEKAVGLNTAALQQGVLQIVRDFCNYSNALCDRCQFPGLVHNTKRA